MLKTEVINASKLWEQMLGKVVIWRKMPSSSDGNARIRCSKAHRAHQAYQALPCVMMARMLPFDEPKLSHHLILNTRTCMRELRGHAVYSVRTT